MTEVTEMQIVEQHVDNSYNSIEINGSNQQSSKFSKNTSVVRQSKIKADAKDVEYRSISQSSDFGNRLKRKQTNQVDMQSPIKDEKDQ